MEIWDAYNSDFELIDGMSLIRGEESSIPDGVYHLVCHILVKHKDGTFLLMRRDLRKAYPGMWEATAGGSALKGETPLECALRELKEETGITAATLEEIRRFVWDSTHCVHVEYLCETDCDKDSIVLLSCDKDNAASAGVIRKCDGLLKDELYSETFGENIQMYAIRLYTVT